MPMSFQSVPFIGTMTWQQLQTNYPTAVTGMTARITDYGVPYLNVIFDGARWKVNSVQILARSNIAVSCPADTTEDTLATITVPAGIMGINGSLRITTSWTTTNSANTKTLKVRFGGVSGSGLMNVSITANAAYYGLFSISNMNAANSQLSDGGAIGSPGGTAGGAISSSVDTTADTTIVITGQKAASGETLTLNKSRVEIMP